MGKERTINHHLSVANRRGRGEASMEALELGSLWGLFWYPRLGWVHHVNNETQPNSQSNRWYQNRPLKPPFLAERKEFTLQARWTCAGNGELHTNTSQYELRNPLLSSKNQARIWTLVNRLACKCIRVLTHSSFELLLKKYMIAK
ncbi:hypothetical protein AVEN_238918-1 [Araneus ventricosus]|uniref:Uncharacterized protein n=1 Tax=Araneus ventricosus TaxID=182803 RepID=A0A4Y2LKQ7_ARAVE|nr:hypothetical protein AVEN_238918-1 [Araneus ventricosus]